MRFWLFIGLLFIGFSGLATHNRSGYISYCYNINTGKYDFRIITYTNAQSTSADRCEQILYICDVHGNLVDSLVCPRINNDAICQANYCIGSSCGSCGELIVPPSGGYGGVKYNVYAASITLNPAAYTFTMIDPNRDAGINNIPGSSSVAFALIDTAYAYAGVIGLNTNCTPTFSNPPIQNACAGSPWCYNPGALDPENDSLDFTITRSFMEDGSHPPQGVTPILNESFPSGLNLDRQTGTLCWTSPTVTGEYNIAMLIREYRKNPVDGKRYLVSTTVFDIQILVVPCPPIDISFQNIPQDTCIVAGTTYTANISATETGGSPPLTLSGSGLPFTFPVPDKATLSSNASGNSVSGVFSWTPSCNRIQANPYQITIQAHDNASPYNANFITFNIKVVSLGPTSLTVTNVGDSILLDWSPPPTCSSGSNNPIVRYLIYRGAGCPTYNAPPCETGVPPGVGYQLIGSTNASKTDFIDNNSGNGFPPGNNYSYIVVAQFGDGSMSLPSSSVCIKTRLNVPLVMKVSVDTTDNAIGKMNVWWNKPITSATDFDTTQYPGPYKFILQRRPGSLITTTYTPFYTITHPNYAAIGNYNSMIDSISDYFINTTDTQYYYKLAFYYTDAATSTFKYLGSSAQASSIYAKVIPHDKKVVLSWNVQVPWTNTMYYILKQRLGGPSDAYDIVDSTTAKVDTIYNLTNGHNYCFKILSKGEYANPLIQKYLWNYSQKICVTPKDDEAPCEPTLFVAGNCTTSVNKLVWTNPNHNCNINDVVKYVIYYAPFQDSTLHPIDSLFNPLDTTYTTDYSFSIAGCYAVVAVDSTGNRSLITNKVCTDNCPEYELPNIFTPNNDSLNDQYIPVKNKYIKDVAFTMYNRWGEVVFETSDPALKWDGKSSQMKQPVTDGTYFYICKVREIHYYGYKERMLKGFVQVLH